MSITLSRNRWQIPQGCLEYVSLSSVKYQFSFGRYLLDFKIDNDVGLTLIRIFFDAKQGCPSGLIYCPNMLKAVSNPAFLSRGRSRETSIK